jgi:hypothetical protein
MFNPKDRILKVLALDLNGDVGGLTTYTNRRHKIIAFPQAPPTVPPTPNQIIQRARLRTIALAWLALGAPQRAMWRVAATRANLSISGWNLYAACKMRKDWSYAQTIENQTHIVLTHA